MTAARAAFGLTRGFLTAQAGATLGPVWHSWSRVLRAAGWALGFLEAGVRRGG
jgi:hypothetical protein